jgi:hypothetical protein
VPSPPTSALQRFLAELHASPEVQGALASGVVVNGETIAQHLVGMERMVEYVERDDDALAVTVHDGASAIVCRHDSLKARLFALLEFLKAHDPRPRKQ